MKWNRITGFSAASLASVSGVASILAALTELRHVVALLVEEFSGIESPSDLFKAITYKSDIQLVGSIVTALMVLGSLVIIIRGISSLFQSILRWERKKVSTKTKITVNTAKGRKELDVDLANSSSVLRTLRKQSGRKRPSPRLR